MATESLGSACYHMPSLLSIADSRIAAGPIGTSILGPMVTESTGSACCHMPTLLNISAARVAAMQHYIATVVRPAVLFDYRGHAPDAFSAFLSELLHLSKTRLPRLDPA